MEYKDQSKKARLTVSLKDETTFKLEELVILLGITKSGAIELAFKIISEKGTIMKSKTILSI